MFSDENGKDQGVNVRQKVKEMIEFVQDDDRLREERKKAKKNRDKYIGVSSDSMSGFRYCKSLTSSLFHTHTHTHCPHHHVYRGFQGVLYHTANTFIIRNSFKWDYLKSRRSRLLSTVIISEGFALPDQ